MMMCKIFQLCQRQVTVDESPLEHLMLTERKRISINYMLLHCAFMARIQSSIALGSEISKGFPVK